MKWVSIFSVVGDYSDSLSFDKSIDNQITFVAFASPFFAFVSPFPSSLSLDSFQSEQQKWNKEFRLLKNNPPSYLIINK